MKTKLFFSICMILGLIGLVLPLQAQENSSNKVYKIELRGEVETGLSAFIERGVKTAEAGNAKAFLLDIDTPGGRVDAALQIKDLLLSSKVPVITYVNRHALSAGALIAMAGEKMYMAPGSAIGAATPIIGEVTEKAPEKIVSALRSSFASTAEARGRSPNVAKAMVDDEISFGTYAPSGKLLTLTAQEAKRLEFTDGIKNTQEDVLSAVNASDADIIVLTPSAAENFVRFITSAMVSSLLLTIGFLGITLELKTPGFGFGGLLAIAAYGLFFWGHHLAGLAGMEDILLVLGGVFLIILEIFVIPGFGVIGLAGLIAVLAGLIMALTGNPDVVPVEAYIDAATNVSIALFSAIVLALIVVKMIFKDNMFSSGFVLTGSYRDDHNVSQSEAKYKEHEIANTLKIGEKGKAHTALRPAGTAIFKDKKYSVVTEGDFIDAKANIEIVLIEGGRIVVR